MLALCCGLRAAPSIGRGVDDTYRCLMFFAEKKTKEKVSGKPMKTTEVILTREQQKVGGDPE